MGPQVPFHMMINPIGTSWFHSQVFNYKLAYKGHRVSPVIVYG